MRLVGDEIVSARVRKINSRSGVVHEWQCCAISLFGYFAGRSSVTVFRDFSHMFPSLY